MTVPEVKVPATVQGSEVVPSSATGNAASPPKPESTEMAGMASAEPSLPKPESTGLAVIAPASEMPPPALPALAPPAAPPLPPPLVIPPLAGVGEATPSTTPTVEATEKPQHKTWETKLIQPVIPKETRFQYKRILMPSEIYRTGYNRENSHLPRRVTRAEYEGLLFTSIARRDLNAMRALLNAGTNIHARNAYGETPFAFARRIGAMEVAAVLAARGGR